MLDKVGTSIISIYRGVLHWNNLNAAYCACCAKCRGAKLRTQGKGEMIYSFSIDIHDVKSSDIARTVKGIHVHTFINTAPEQVELAAPAAWAGQGQFKVKCKLGVKLFEERLLAFRVLWP